MKLEILKVILWPKNSLLLPRIIEFKPGHINVISGQSQTGKSALLAIVDYALGSGKCTIPVGLIRNVTEWFGLHVAVENTELIIARRNPGEKQETNEMFWDEGTKLIVPHEVSANSRIDDLKERFNRLGQLPSLDLTASSVRGFGARPSFRDMAAFNFLPQHIVANPLTLFFKADTTEHREKLKALLPFVLGAIDAETLVKQRELSDVEREYNTASRELEARRNVARAWETEIQSYFLQARSFGLIPSSVGSTATWDFEKYILELQRVPDNVKKLDLPEIEEGTTAAGVVELRQIIEEEDLISRKLGAVRRRFQKLDQVSASVIDYTLTLTAQEDRIESIGWFEKKFRIDRCPVCNTSHSSENTHLASLRELARSFGDLASAVRQAPTRLDEELADLREEARLLEVELSHVRQKRKLLESDSEEAAEQRNQVRQIYLFVGRIEQALENVSVGSTVGALGEQVSLLKARVAALKQELDPAAQKRKLDSAVELVSRKIYEYATYLGLEHSDENVQLDVRELTLRFSPRSGRTDYLWEVGSGQNWMGYHIATFLALHEHFTSLRASPVPRFLVIDQPSQVYFPEGWESLDTPNGDNESLDKRSADVEGVRQMFLALSRFLDSVDRKFQIIVTEHAGSMTWSKVSHIHMVGNWRDGHDTFLIPASWRLEPEAEPGTEVAADREVDVAAEVEAEADAEADPEGEG